MLSRMPILLGQEELLVAGNTPGFCVMGKWPLLQLSFSFVGRGVLPYVSLAYRE